MSQVSAIHKLAGHAMSEASIHNDVFELCAGTTSPSLMWGQKTWSSDTGLQPSTRLDSAGYSGTTIR
jgi:hypothetical protein